MKKIFGLLKSVGIAFVLLIVLGLFLGRGGSSEESGSQSAPKEEAAQAQSADSEKEAAAEEEPAAEEEAEPEAEAEPEPEPEPEPEGPKMATNSDYTVTIDGFTITQDYDGAPCIAVDYTFTNVSDSSPTSMQLATNITVYQNGVECEDAYFADGNSSDGYTNKVKAGVSVNCTRAYKLQDTTSDVEIEVAPLFSWDDALLAYQVYQIA